MAWLMYSDGKSEHVAHVGRKIGIYEVNLRLATADDLPHTDKMTCFTPYVRTYIWAAIEYKYHII